MGKRRVEDLRMWRGENAVGCEGEGTSGETGLGVAGVVLFLVPVVVPMVGEPPVVDDVEAEEAVEKRREEDVVASEIEANGREDYTPLR